MSKDWIRNTEAGLVTQAQEVSAEISAHTALFSLQPADATSLAAAVTAFVTAYDAYANPTTRTPVNLVIKNQKMDQLVTLMRSLGQRIQSSPTVAPETKASIGLKSRDFRPSPIPAPATRPVLQVTGTVGRTISVRVADELTPTRRAKASGASGAQIFSFIGATAPQQLSEWTFEALATRAIFDVVLPPGTAEGTKVWICARWQTATGKTGPVGDAVAAYVIGGISEAA